MELLCYTRKPLEDILYANRLAFSMHLALRDQKKGRFVPLHHNEGIVYAEAVSREDGTLCAKSLRSPWLFETGNGWGVVAVRTEAEGEDDPESEGCILLFDTEDLVHYTEKGLFRLQEKGYIRQVRCVYEKEKNVYLLCWQREDGSWMKGEAHLFEETGLATGAATAMDGSCVEGDVPSSDETMEIEGAVPGNAVEIPEEAGKYLKNKLTAPVCVGMRLSSQGPFASEEELRQVRAIASYSDGSEVVRNVDWEFPAGADGLVRGRVHQAHFDFPFAEYRTDPCCMYRDGKYYFIATNDADHNHTLYMRCSPTLEGIVTAEEKLFLDSETYPDVKGLLWAPEFHTINGKLYMFHAATPSEFYWQVSRVRELKEGGDPMCKEDWSEPRPVLKKDGSRLTEGGKVISLDMTVIPYEGKYYVMWSQRQYVPVDQGAWLYIAQIDEKEPWKLVTDPVCIKKPEYGWENNHTFVVEGPYRLEMENEIFIAYSGALIDATYTIGLLKLKKGKDILDPKSWEKIGYPLQSSRSAEGEYGTGHNSFLQDTDGLVWNFYHGKKGINGPRSSGARRVHFDVDGEPMLDVTEDRDLPEEFRFVEAKLSGPAGK